MEKSPLLFGRLIYACSDTDRGGHAPVLVGISAASATYKFCTSQHSPWVSTTELSRATPRRALPI